ncbi:hypothetical protein LIN78_11040 [Leeia sp. TBRC 13508]|uniref:Uncharacterized protein n=1 Tax=Leeia speluncae TaxID=2884804 RepID=A0ABS8D7A1_9NEIS|nr:glycosyltransferase family 9 protein [Leeia speluncae]MCB6184081.1 hypothetical protein [Leeia speluncae]
MAMQNGRFAEAIPHWHSLLKENELNAHIHYLLSFCYFHTAKSLSALTHAKRAYELDINVIEYRGLYFDLLVNSRRNFLYIAETERWSLVSDLATQQSSVASAVWMANLFDSSNRGIEKLTNIAIEDATTATLTEISAAAFVAPAYSLLTNLFIQRKDLFPVEDQMLLFTVGLAYLIQGDYEKGWPLYRCRADAAEELYKYPELMHLPAWDGHIASDLVLLIHGEQGAGDVIMCARYIARLHQMGIRTILNLSPQLMGLFSPSMNQDHSGALEGSEEVSLDMVTAQIRMMDLPAMLDSEGPVAESAYLSIPKNSELKWASALEKCRYPKVGIIWKGNPNHGWDHFRSTTWKSFCQLFAIPEIDWFICQHEFDVPKMYEGWACIHRVGDKFESFADSAALISQLDLVISVDTSVAHLAGALGVPVWMLISEQGQDWRWGTSEKPSSWYQSMRIFRRSSAVEWSSFIKNDLTSALIDWRRSHALLSDVAGQYLNTYFTPDWKSLFAMSLAGQNQLPDWVWLRALECNDNVLIDALKGAFDQIENPTFADGLKEALFAFNDAQAQVSLANNFILSNSPCFAHAWILSQVCVQGGNRSIDWANLVTNANQAYPNQIEIILARAYVAYVLKKSLLAEKLHLEEELLLIADKDVRAFYYLALFSINNGKLLVAVDYLERFLKFYPAFEPGWELLQEISLKCRSPYLGWLASFKLIKLRNELSFSQEIMFILSMGQLSLKDEARQRYECLVTENSFDINALDKENVVDALIQFGHLGGNIEEVLKPLLEVMQTLDEENKRHLHWVIGWMQIRCGIYSEGWKNYAIGLNPRISSRGNLDAILPEQVLIYQDQGLGDLIQAWRMLNKIGKKGCRLAVGKDILPLLNVQTHDYELIELNGIEEYERDYECIRPVMQLYAEWESEKPATPVDHSYLNVPEELTLKYATQLKELPGLKVGIVWAGNPGLQADHFRSTHLKDWLSLLDVEGVSLISLQKDDASNQVFQAPAFLERLVNGGALCESLLDTAALIMNLDLVIAPDTGIVHLAAALGKPVWLLNYAVHTDFRWGTEGESSHFYPTIKMFRQQGPWEPWSDVLARVAVALREMVDGKQQDNPR